MRRPVAGDCAEYYFRYIDQVPGDDVLEVLRTEIERSVQQLAGSSEQQALHRYETGKWSLKEVLGHMVDVERVFGGRALWIARTEGAELPGMDQDAWAAQALTCPCP